MAALKSIKGSTIFATATKVKKMMSDFNFNQIPSEIKYFIPGKVTVNDIPNLFGSLQKMKIPQVHFEVVNSYTTDLSGIDNIITVHDKSTWVNDYNKQVIRQINIDNDNITTTTQISPTIILLSLVRWIPWGNKGDTERNGFISPDFVKSFISELLNTDRSMSLFEVNDMS
jgi:hypothetical protein